MGLALKTYPTLTAAGEALAAQATARYIGGGTLVVRDANEGDLRFDTYVSASDPELSAIAVTDGQATIGAGVTMAGIVREPALGFLAPAAKAVGGPAIRNMATVGGNLFAPTPYGDFTVALVALDASLDIEGAAVPVTDFLTGRETIYARALVRAVSFRLPAEGSFRFAKVSRIRPKGLSIVTIAAVVEERSGAITSARIAYGCMADRPIRAPAVERALIGKARTKDGIAAALAVATEGTSPPTDAIASAWYRSEVLPVHLGRLLLSP